MNMLKKSTYLPAFLVILFLLQLFANRNLIAQENKSSTTSWTTIFEQLNALEDIHEAAKSNHLGLISDLIANKLTPPNKEDISTIKSNRLKLMLANILTDKKKYLWAEEIFRQIDARKLTNTECRNLFEIETIFLLLYPDREISLNILDSLKSIIKICRLELTNNPGHLNDLYHFYINKQMLPEALEIAGLLWRDDAYHFQCGALHQRAYRLRWEAKNNTIGN